MSHLISIAIVLLCLALVCSVLYYAFLFCIQFPRSSTTVISVVVLAGIIGFKHIEAKHHLSLVPLGLRVEKVLYAEEQSWGFGPGGNETGVIEYELPEDIAAQIDKIGIMFFAMAPPQAADGFDPSGQYRTWQQTPILLDGSGLGAEATQNHEISNFLASHGFGIFIDPKLEKRINSSISQPGSFAAFGRGGVLIVNPKTRRIMYAYNG